MFVIASFSKYQPIKTKNKHEEYTNLLKQKSPAIILAIGPAGCGKTFTAIKTGLDELINGSYKKLVLTRPTIPIDNQDIGYLPGSLHNKMDPWLSPFYDSIEKNVIDKLISKKSIEISPLAYMRGRTFKNSFIICDEAQNITPNGMLMMLTRLGEQSKLIITGDVSQADSDFNNNGMIDLLKRYNEKDEEELLNLTKEFKILIFNESDILRHDVIKDLLKLYNKKY